MNSQLHERLAKLRKEFENGQAKHREMDMQQAHLREALLRISGAIQVLEELLAEAPADTGSQSRSTGTPG